MVDRISLPKARNIKSMSWITPAGATLSRNLRIPILLRQELVRAESSSSERMCPRPLVVVVVCCLSADYRKKAGSYGVHSG